MITAARISLRVIPPSSRYMRLAFSLRPGMRSFSGLQKNMKKPQSRKTISQPIGEHVVGERAKKLISTFIMSL